MRAVRCCLALGAALAVLAGCAREAAAPAAVPAAPAQRIVALAPHLAELVYSAGAGERLVGVVAFSDFPPEVEALPQVGDAFRVDYEAITALRPDLVLAWTSGNPPETVARLRALDLNVVALEPERIADIADHIERIGVLAGTTAVAAATAMRFRERLAALGGGADPLRVFVQIADRPYFTVTDRHFLGQALRLCGGENVFGSLPGLTATVGLEAILEARPAVIVASDMGGAGAAPLAGWTAWPDLPAVRAGNLYTIDADLLSRPSVRILDGVQALCGVLGEVRAKARLQPQFSGRSAPR